jgi:hypothetical protein
MRPPEPLGAQHQLEGFDCGNVALNRWLQQRALANERQGVSRTVVLCPDEDSTVIAYACLSAGAIVLAEVPGALRRNRPDPLPVVVLGRLAVEDAGDDWVNGFSRYKKGRHSFQGGGSIGDLDCAVLHVINRWGRAKGRLGDLKQKQQELIDKAQDLLAPPPRPSGNGHGSAAGTPTPCAPPCSSWPRPMPASITVWRKSWATAPRQSKNPVS